MDNKIIEIIENINDFESISVVKFPVVAFERTSGELILVVLTYATHHRGEISATLDILGIENEFTGLPAMRYTVLKDKCLARS